MRDAKIPFLLDHPFLRRLPESIRLTAFHLLHTLESEDQASPTAILCLACGIAATEVTCGTGEKQKNWRIVLKALADDWDNALDCVDEILKARHRRLVSSYDESVSLLSNFRFDTQVDTLSDGTTLIDHPFVRSLPDALRLPALRIFHAAASDKQTPSPSSVVVCACAIASNAAANEGGIVHHNGRVLLSALADNWENALDCAKQILLTRPRYIRMNRIEFIARQMWALNTERIA